MHTKIFYYKIHATKFIEEVSNERVLSYLVILVTILKFRIGQKGLDIFFVFPTNNIL